MKSLYIASLIGAILLCAIVCFAGPEFEGEINVAGKNNVDVTSIGGREAQILWGAVKARDGLVETTTTNVGGVNVYNKKVHRNQRITVINNNKGTVYNDGDELVVGGVQMGKKR